MGSLPLIFVNMPVYTPNTLLRDPCGQRGKSCTNQITSFKFLYKIGNRTTKAAVAVSTKAPEKFQKSHEYENVEFVSNTSSTLLPTVHTHSYKAFHGFINVMDGCWRRQLLNSILI